MKKTQLHLVIGACYDPNALNAADAIGQSDSMPMSRTTGYQCMRGSFLFTSTYMFLHVEMHKCRIVI